MAKLTLLSLTQKILTSMDSDDVNSISDTEEALSVVDIIEDTYFEMMAPNDWPHLQETCQLDSVGDTGTPTNLQIPEIVGQIEHLKYEITETGDEDRSWRTLTYCHPQDFIDKLLVRSSSDADTTVVTLDSGVDLIVFNDRMPNFYTSFDDDVIIADAYNSSEESTLQGSNTILHCIKSPVFSKTDAFIPDLPEKAFPLLLAECKRACHLYLKQQDSPTDARRSLKGTHRFRNEGWRAHDQKKKIKFGRK